jgi:hypothetical protein
MVGTDVGLGVAVEGTGLEVDATLVVGAGRLAVPVGAGVDVGRLQPVKEKMSHSPRSSCFVFMPILIPLKRRGVNAIADVLCVTTRLFGIFYERQDKYVI